MPTKRSRPRATLSAPWSHLPLTLPPPLSLSPSHFLSLFPIFICGFFFIFLASLHTSSLSVALIVPHVREIGKQARKGRGRSRGKGSSNLPHHCGRFSIGVSAIWSGQFLSNAASWAMTLPVSCLAPSTAPHPCLPLLTAFKIEIAQADCVTSSASADVDGNAQIFP